MAWQGSAGQRSTAHDREANGRIGHGWAGKFMVGQGREGQGIEEKRRLGYGRSGSVRQEGSTVYGRTGHIMLYDIMWWYAISGHIIWARI